MCDRVKVLLELLEGCGTADLSRRNNFHREFYFLEVV